MSFEETLKQVSETVLPGITEVQNRHTLKKYGSVGAGDER